MVAVIKRYSAFRFDKPDDETETSSVIGESNAKRSFVTVIVSGLIPMA